MDIVEQPAKRVRIDPDIGPSSSEWLTSMTEEGQETVQCTVLSNSAGDDPCTSSRNMSVTSPVHTTTEANHANITNFNDPQNDKVKSKNETIISCSLTELEKSLDKETDTVCCATNMEQESEHFDKGDNVSAVNPHGGVESDHDVKVKSVYDLEMEEDSEVSIPSLQSLRMKSDNKENVINKNSPVLLSAAKDSEKVQDNVASDSTTISENRKESQTDTCVKLNVTEEVSKQPSVPVSSQGSVGSKTKHQRRVSYIYSKELIQQCNLMQKIPNRASMVHSLIEAYGILKYMRVIAPSKGTEESLCVFHSPEYIEFLKKINDQDDEEIYDEEAALFGLTYDCPVHQGVFDYALAVGGATVSAAEELVRGQCDVAINWCGGWHHGQKDSASGFCYVNDIVLGILKLREKFSRVLYVDLDLHHGDGVQNAFYATSAVMTVSIHKYAAGFFPGTGQLEDIGIGKGKKYSINIPLQDGARDQEFVALFCRVIQKVRAVFRPEALVCQCGADGLAGDPMDSFNLTSLSLGRCVYFLLDWALPTLILGGGGYHHTNTARCWTFLTSVAVGKKLPTDIPDHKYFMEYGPDYGIDISAGNRKDQNSQEYLRKVHRYIIDLLSQ